MIDVFRFNLARSPQRKAVMALDTVEPLRAQLSTDNIVNFVGTDLLSKLFQNSQLHEAGKEIMQSLLVLLSDQAQNLKNDAANNLFASIHMLTHDNGLDPDSTFVLLDDWLVAHQDLPEPEDLAKQLDKMAQNVASRSIALPDSAALKVLLLDPHFWIDWLRIISSWAVYLFYNSSESTAVDMRGYLMRLIQVYGLIDSLVKTHGNLPDKEGIYNLLHNRHVVIPVNLLRHLKRQNPSIRKPGFTDLYVIKEQWKAFEAGEIAHVENVLPHELKKRSFERLDESETITQDETFRSEINQHDSESTNRFDLQAAISQEMSANLSAEFSNDTSAYGPSITNNTHIGGAVDVSYNQSNSHAIKSSRELVTRATSRIQNDVRKIRQQRTLTRITQKDRHELNNESDNAIAGVYRWLDKLKQVVLWRYPNRFVVEVQLPEPGAWTRWLLDKSNKDKAATLPHDPGPFPALLPQDISYDDDSKTTDYRYLTMLFNARGIQPPPANIIVATTVEYNPGDGELVYNNYGEYLMRFDYYKDATISVEEGWQAVHWKAAITASLKGDLLSTNIPAEYNLRKIALIVGGFGNGTSEITDHLTNMDGASDPNLVDPNASLTGPVGAINRGTVPIVVETNAVYGFMINILVTCEPTPEAIMQWKFDTYQALLEAHTRQRQQYNDAKASQAILEGVAIDGMSPQQSKTLMTNEIKRQTIELLMGSDFYGRGSLKTRDSTNGEPAIDATLAGRYAPEIQFMETAFEWINLSWAFYPYYWAAHGSWPDLALLQSADADFDAFLNSGSARITISARPGFEAQVLLYLQYGILWGGGSMPSPQDPLYLSVAEEIRDLQQGNSDGVVVDSWEVRLPTTLLLLDSNAQFPIHNPAVTAA